MRGVVRRYLTAKKFGFLVEDGGSTEIFFHLSNFKFGPESGPPPLPDEPVEFTLSHDGVSRAASVERLVHPQHWEGVITSYDPVNGYGFVRCSAGQVFLHKSEVLGSAIPAVNSRVSFYTTGSLAKDRKSRACYVSLLT